jgi:hypothetical protein
MLLFKMPNPKKPKILDPGVVGMPFFVAVLHGTTSKPQKKNKRASKNLHA